MSETYDPDLFRGAAEYYTRFRPPYAREAIDHVIAAFSLGRGDRVLDLGCGPGTLTIPFARVAGDVLAMDPDPGMIAEGRRQATAAGLMNIEWREAGSRELGQVAGPFKLVLMGQSFHWMDRDQVLRDLYGLVEDGGGLAAIAPGERRPQEVLGSRSRPDRAPVHGRTALASAEEPRAPARAGVGTLAVRDRVVCRVPLDPDAQLGLDHRLPLFELEFDPSPVGRPRSGVRGRDPRRHAAAQSNRCLP